MLAGLRNLLSTMNMVWVLIMAPVALISTIEDLSKWESAFGGPLAYWREKVEATSEVLPFVRGLPADALSALYFGMFILIVVFTFLVTVSLEARRQKKLAMSIDFGSVEAARYRGSAGESLMEGAAGAGLAGILGLSGPVGWAVALGAMGTMMAVRWAVQQGEADAHAAAQTAEINARREAHIDAAVAQFVRSERGRLLTGAVIALAIVVVSFVLGSR